MLYKAQEEIVNIFYDYSIIASEAKFIAIHGEGLKQFIPKEMLQKSTIPLVRVQAGKTPENFLNEICQIIYSLYQASEITKKVYHSTMTSVNI